MFCHIGSDPAMFRALAHHVQGVSPPCYTPRAKARLPNGLVGVHQKVDLHVVKGFTIKIITGKHVYLHLSLMFSR